MRVIQLLSTIANGDAVSNDAVALEKVIKSMGYSTGIYAESIVSNVKELPSLLRRLEYWTNRMCSYIIFLQEQSLIMI